MSNSELLKEIKELKQKISELENAYIDKQKYTRWRAEKDDGIYFYVNLAGKITKYPESRHPVDNFLYSIGNYFKTKEEAEEYKENLITKQKLKDLALRLNEGVEIDWKSTHQTKYSLYLDIDEHLDNDSCCIIKATAQIYCLNKNFLDIAKEEIGEEALIKLIKSGV